MSSPVKITPAILCGGGGERLWPLSRASFPKHLVRLRDQPSLLERTVDRLAEALPGAAPILLCNESDRFLVAEQVTGRMTEKPIILLEPERRDTAAAVALAVAAAIESDPAGLLVVCPADHHIPSSADFAAAVARAVTVAQQGHIVTFGLTPDNPHTGYGYLQTGDPLPGTASLSVKRFVEKPSEADAVRMVESGGYFWNAGIFLFAAKTMQQAFERHAPKVWESAQKAYLGAYRDLDFVRLDREAYAKAPKISIDYAVMEKVPNLALVPVGFEWSDVGSWSALSAMFDKDADGNAVHGRVVLDDTRDTFVYTDADGVVAALGLEDMIVAVTNDAVLVCPKSRAQDVKGTVAKLRALGHAEATEHRLTYRPWGTYRPVARGTRFQVKQITVHPGGALSLQKHFHRSEHWIVVSGTARVIVGDRETLVSENESIYIPLGSVHRLENPGKIPLELIEVQTGSYLGEDDLVRLEDKYKRS